MFSVEFCRLEHYTVSLLKANRRFWGIYRLHVQGGRICGTRNHYESGSWSLVWLVLWHPRWRRVVALKHGLPFNNLHVVTLYNRLRENLLFFSISYHRYAFRSLSSLNQYSRIIFILQVTVSSCHLCASKLHGSTDTACEGRNVHAKSILNVSRWGSWLGFWNIRFASDGQSCACWRNFLHWTCITAINNACNFSFSYNRQFI